MGAENCIKRNDNRLQNDFVDGFSFVKNFLNKDFEFNFVNGKIRVIEKSMKINQYILGTTVFICGSVVMIFELVGSRVLGPYFGTSIFIWTSLIGVILGSLSLGYYCGGRIADKKLDINILSLIIFLSAIFIGLTVVFKQFFLVWLSNSVFGLRISSVIASLVLFSPASVLLGMVSPYAMRFKLENIDNSGTIIGNFYAISTLGSIFGTFLSGFYLIPYFGTNKLLLILSISLIIISLILSMSNLRKVKIGILLLLIFGIIVADIVNLLYSSYGLIDVDTAYNRIWIYEYQDINTKENIRTFLINNEISSAMYVDKDGLVYEYAEYYHLARHFFPNFSSTLMLGGAGYSFPKDFLLKYPEASIDVIEIDPKVTELAKKHFNLKENSRLVTYNQDGRVYLNQTQKKYDVIFGDAFSSYHSLPYQLTTREAVQNKYNILNNDGVVILNIISSIEGEKGQFLRAEYATYKSIFPQVYLFPVIDQYDGEALQNIILVAIKSDKKPGFSSPDQEINKCLKHLWNKKIETDRPVLTDDYAPVDWYVGKII